MNKSKQYEIPKRAVIEAYKRVKANKGSAGIDGMDFEKFEERLNNNLYKIWNRMSSGSYFPSPVMAVEIPKKSGGTRRLGNTDYSRPDCTDGRKSICRTGSGAYVL